MELKLPINFTFSPYLWAAIIFKQYDYHQETTEPTAESGLSV